MKHSGKMLVWVGSLAACAVAYGVPAEAPDNPYQSIIDRNVFSLKPPPPPPDPAEANKPQVVKITLTGITTILGNKRVLMKAAPPAGKPGEAAKAELSYILTEGQREGDLEVIQIDEKAGSVKVNNGGTVQTLTFEKDGAKLPSTPAPTPAGAPGAVAIPGLPVTHPQPGVPTPTTPNFQLPSRIPRLPSQGGQAASATGAPLSAVGASPNYANPGFLPGNTSTPILQNGAPAPTQTQTILPGSNLSLEEQAIMIEANRQAGGPGAAMLPPTILTPKTSEETPNTGGRQLQSPSFPMFPGSNLPPAPGGPF